MELNREQVVKALTMFIEDMPAELHLGFTRTVMFRGLLQDTLALIRELTEECKKWQSRLEIECDYTKADTVRKMQERLEASCDAPHWCVWLGEIDQIAKEMLEEV